MDRILQGVGATLSATFESAGVAVDPAPDTAMIEIRRSDGTLVTAGVGPVYNDGVGKFSVDLTSEATAKLDRLTASWTASFAGHPDTVVTRTEIVGGFYFSIGEFRAAYPDDDEVQGAPADKIAAKRALAEDIIEGLDAEDGTHVAFVPRADTFTLSGAGSTRIAIPRHRLRSVEALTIGGVASDLAGVTLEGSSVFVPHWPAGFSNVAIRVTHGYDQPPGRIKDAAIVLTYHRLVKGPIDDRATGRLSPEGSVITLATPGLRGAITGIPEVDAAIQQYAKKRPRVRSIVTTDRANEFPASDWLSRYA